MTTGADRAAGPVRIAACGGVTALGDERETVAGLRAGRVALRLHPVLGRDGGDPVPLATIGGAYDETLPPRWLAPVRALLRRVPEDGWGGERRPVVVTSSNFGVGSLYAFRREPGQEAHLRHGPPWAAVELLQRELGWGGNVTTFSHACVTAHLGLLHATRLLAAGQADAALVVAFDFTSPFVAGGFHSLKILNAALPAPYAAREAGAIGLGDGAAFAVLRAGDAGPAGGAAGGARCNGETDTGFRLEAQALFNEMFHFTANAPDGSGFETCAREIAAAVRGRRVWVKGHGTGTLDAGRLEAEAVARVFPGAPLVSWKGSLGHTLGSCGLVELVLAVEAMRTGTIPGTVAGVAPTLAPNVALGPLAAGDYDAAVLLSNAFGGAQAGLLLTRAGGADGPESAGASATLPAAPAAGREGAARPVATPRGPGAIERSIRYARVELPPDTEGAAEARERLRDAFPRGAMRRMTHLGMLLGAAAQGVAWTRGTAVVYASSFAETRALEDFLASFPAASPLLFQTSIHPGGVQQVLIGRQQPVARLWPLAGRARLAEQALLAALLEPAEPTVLLAGEERGTWLRERNLASGRSWALALVLGGGAEAEELGRVRFEPDAYPETRDETAAGGAPEPVALAEAVAARRPQRWRGAGGTWTVTWR